jgi:hypothetical protein
MNRWRRAALCGVWCALLAMVPSWAYADWRKDLEAKLEAQWTMAKLTFLADNIRTAGTPLVMMQAGVHAEREFFATNDVVGGQVRPQSMSNKLGAFLAEARDSEAHQYRVVLPQYQPIYLTNISVGRERITVQIATRGQFLLEMVDRDAIGRVAAGTSRKGDRLTKTDAAVRKAALIFHVGPDLEQKPFEAIVAMMNRVFVRADHPDVPRPGAVSLGMDREVVLRNLGRPLNVVSLGTREVLVFEKIKVTLENGKVVDVQ